MLFLWVVNRRQEMYIQHGNGVLLVFSIRFGLPKCPLARGVKVLGRSLEKFSHDILYKVGQALRSIFRKLIAIE
jgi:energy-converting hydrogenase Eha subunit B